MSRDNDATAWQNPNDTAQDNLDADMTTSAAADGVDAAQPQSGADKGKLAELTAKNAELKDQLLRMAAEADNVRRRAEKERQDTAKYAVGTLARELLPVADNLRRALEHLPEGSELTSAVKALITGVEATERQLLAAFERAGIKPMNAQGQPFDPNFHRVMQEVDSPNHAPGTVVHVMQNGYTIHDRLLREAMVVVAKGQPADRVDHSA